MRSRVALSLAVLLGACARPIEIDVVVDDKDSFLATIRPRGVACECNVGGFADVDQCVSGEDGIRPCSCDDGSSVLGCLAGAHLESPNGQARDLGPLDDVRELGLVGGTANAGDFIVFEGCGDALRVPIPSDAPPAATTTVSAADGTIAVHVDTDATLVTACSGGGFSDTCCGHAPGAIFGFPLTSDASCDVDELIQVAALVDERSTSDAHARVFRSGPRADGRPCIPTTDADGLLSCALCGGSAVVGEQAGASAVHFDPARASHVRVDAGATIEVDGDVVTVTGASGIGSAAGAVLTGGPVVVGAFRSTELVLAPIDVTIVDDTNPSSTATVTVSFDVEVPPVASTP